MKAKYVLSSVVFTLMSHVWFVFVPIHVGHARPALFDGSIVTLPWSIRVVLLLFIVASGSGLAYGVHVFSPDLDRTRLGPVWIVGIVSTSIFSLIFPYATGQQFGGGRFYVQNGVTSMAVIASLSLSVWGMARSYCYIKEDELRESIAALKNDHSVSRRRKAAKALGRAMMRDPRSVGKLIEALDDSSPYVRAEAGKALGRIRDSRAVKPLIAALGDEDALVRDKAAKALAGITGRRFGQDARKWQEWWELPEKGEATWTRNIVTINSLIAALENENWALRAGAAIKLGCINEPGSRAVNSLIAALSDKSASVRANAAWALGRTGDLRAVEGLSGMLDDEDYSARNSARSALREIATRNFGVFAHLTLRHLVKDREKLRNWWAKNAENGRKGHRRICHPFK